MKNEAKLEKWGMGKRVRFYYRKYGVDGDGRAEGGVATVCLLPSPDGGGVYARGVSFCNPKDQFNRKLGRAVALGRAIKAYEQSGAFDLVPKYVPAFLLRQDGIMFMSEWDAKLTEYEKKLVS